jgi:hypothetical protein
MEDRICITKEAKGLGFFEKYLTVWVILSILAGIGLGKVAPDFAKALDGMALSVGGAPVVSIPIAVCLFFMMYPNLFHHRHRTGIQSVGFDPRRPNLHGVSVEMTGPSFRHLAAARVSGTEKQYLQLLLHTVFFLPLNPQWSFSLCSLTISWIFDLSFIRKPASRTEFRIHSSSRGSTSVSIR